VKRSSIFLSLGILILAGTSAWSGYALLAESPVIDEAPHLAAGISYFLLGDYRLNPEHPPLIKLAAGLFASAISPALPTAAPWWATGINEQWVVGDMLINGGTENPALIVALGRLGVTLLNLILLTLVWRIAARRLGESWGLALLTLIALSPLFLGHAHLITTDWTATLMALLALYATAHAYMVRSTRSTMVAGLITGAALLAKFSLILLIPTLGITALAAGYLSKRKEYRSLLMQTAAIGAIAIGLVIMPTYALITRNATNEISGRDTKFLLSSFAGGPATGWCNPMRCLAEATIWGAEHTLTRPLATYSLGVLMVIQRSSGGNTVYFDGVVGAAGSKRYFPYLLATKETLPALLILGIGIVLLIKNTKRLGVYEVIFGSFVALYVLSTLNSSLNIGIRHIMPIIPVLYVGALLGWKQASKQHAWARYSLVALVSIHGITGLLALPHPLAYYNALAGGTDEGFYIAADSNYDWGQDLIYLKQWLTSHPEIERIAVDTYGAADAQILLGSRAYPWSSEQGNPGAYGIDWFAVSINNLLNASGKPMPGEPRLVSDEYRWLKAQRATPVADIPQPDARAGTSIFIYKVN
jgi:hypothetical protein